MRYGVDNQMSQSWKPFSHPGLMIYFPRRKISAAGKIFFFFLFFLSSTTAQDNEGRSLSYTVGRREIQRVIPGGRVEGKRTFD